MIIEYSSNNSGGDWWLKDEDWRSLESAGWKVQWLKERWLGAIAISASKEFDSIDAAVDEFESITGQDANEEGGPCCGYPHNFEEVAK